MGHAKQIKCIRVFLFKLCAFFSHNSNHGKWVSRNCESFISDFNLLTDITSGYYWLCCVIWTLRVRNPPRSLSLFIIQILFKFADKSSNVKPVIWTIDVLYAPQDIWNYDSCDDFMHRHKIMLWFYWWFYVPS